MPIATLRDLYLDRLGELVDAERQMLAALAEFETAATSGELRDALAEHRALTAIHAERLELLLRRMNATGKEHRGEAVRALVADARRLIDDCERGDVLDSALTAAALAIEHYEQAAYGAVLRYAGTLDDSEGSRLLTQTLDEEKEAGARLERLADRGIDRAGEGELREPDRRQPTLRYAPAGVLRDFPYRDAPVCSADGEELGRLDGLIVDARTGQPVYVVVDSGGWFVGRRYLLPVGALASDDEARSLRSTVDREAIRAYPPFDPDSFDGLPGEPPSHGAAGTPAWLMTGVWMTEASGFASVPPRAASDLGEKREAQEQAPAGTDAKRSKPPS